MMKISASIDSSVMKSMSGVANSLKGIETSAKTTSKATSLLATGMGLLGGYISAGAIIKAGKDCVDASNAAATATARLTTTMGNVPGTTPAVVAGLQSYADALEKTTAISHVAQEYGESQLSTYQLHANTIKKLMPALDDLATAQYGVNVTSQNMQDTAMIMGKVMAGDTGILSRYGIQITKSQTAIFKNGTEAQKTAAMLQLMGKRYGGLAIAMANTKAGAVVRLKNAWTDVEEAVGDRLTPVITNLMNVISKNLPTIQTGLVETIAKIGPAIQVAGRILVDLFSFITSNGPAVIGVVAGIGGAFLAFKGIQGVIGIAKDVKKVITDVGNAVQFLKDKQVLQTIATNAAKIATLAWSGVCKLASIAQMAFNAVCDANPIALVVIGIMAAIAAGILLYRNWAAVTKMAKQLGADLQSVFGGIAAWCSNMFGGVWNSIKGFINLIIGGINGVVKGINSVSGVIGKVTGLKLTIPTIPQLAQGGIVPATPGGGLFNLGEGGSPEAVVPLKNGAGVGGGTTINYNVQYSITGNASMNDIKQAGADVQRDFARWMNTWLKSQNRASFAAT